jgi:cytoskeleton protein RodZ
MQEDEPQAVGQTSEFQQPGPSVGSLLTRARESLQLSVEQIAAELRMEPRLLRALEEDRLTELGAPVFAKGYLKQYGQRLGLKYEDLLSRYYDQVEPQDVPITPSRSIKLRDERQITMWLVSALALALLGVLLFLWWISEPNVRALVGDAPPLDSAGSTVTSPRAEPPPAPRASEPEPEPEPEPVPVPGQAAPDGVAKPVAVAPPQQRDAPPQERDAPPQERDAPPPADPALSAALRIELIFDGDCWTEVTAAGGDRLYYGLAHAGEQTRLATDTPVSVLLGNADAVRLLVDGRERPVPQRGRQGKLARFTLRPTED